MWAGVENEMEKATAVIVEIDNDNDLIKAIKAGMMRKERIPNIPCE